MPKKEKTKEPAQKRLQKFLSANNISLDFEVRRNRFINTDEGFVLVPIEKPVIVVKAEYDE